MVDKKLPIANIVCPANCVEDLLSILPTKYFDVVIGNDLMSAFSKATSINYTPPAKSFKGDFLVGELHSEIGAQALSFIDLVLNSVHNKKPVILLNFSPNIVDEFIEKHSIYPNPHIYLFDKKSEKNNHRLVIESLFNFRGLKFLKKKIALLKKHLKSESDLVFDYDIIKYVALAGLDISMSNTGIAALGRYCGRTFVGSLPSDASIKCDYSRANSVRERVRLLPCRDFGGREYLVDIVSCHNFCVEGGALGATQGAYRLGRYNGMLMSNFQIEQVTEIYPTSLKKQITGYGRADKSLVKSKLLDKLGISDFQLNDDESDALALLNTKLWGDKKILQK